MRRRFFFALALALLHVRCTGTAHAQEHNTETIVFPNGVPTDLCSGPFWDEHSRTRCLIMGQFRSSRAATIARELFDTWGHIVGVESARTIDGGFRGVIRLMPERPEGRHGRHLEWVREAFSDFGRFFFWLRGRAREPVRYRHDRLALRFFRSVGRTTPSAYAANWSVAYNASGSLFRSADSTRETLFHEIFHLNDEDHGNWSRALASIHADILARCGTDRTCLAPFAPSRTTVRGGTYYAFQPDNGEGFHEYAAELALRYYQEHRALLLGRRSPYPRPFKCGPPENQRAWSAMIREFFANVDLTADCA